MTDMTTKIFEETTFGKAALKKLGPVPENFRLFQAGWNNDFTEMTVLGADTMQSRGAGEQSPAAMKKQLDKLIKSAGLSDVGINRLSLVRTAVIDSYRAGMRTTDLMIITGFSAETISTILAMDVAQYSPLANWFVQRKESKVKRLEAFKKRRRFMI